MSIVLVKATRISGIEIAPGTPLTLSQDAEADLVARGSATYTSKYTGITEANTVGHAAEHAAMGGLRTRRLTKNVIGRVKPYTPGVDHTTGYACELETDAHAIRIGIPNIHTATVAGVRVSVAVSNACSASTYWLPSTATWVDATFSGASSATLPARIAAERQSMTFTDEIDIQTIARLDGVKRPWVFVKIEYPSGAVLTVPYSGLYFWRTTGALGRLAMAGIHSGVLGVTNSVAFAPTIEALNLVVPAIAYTSKVQGRQVLNIGDSTVEGVGSTPTNLSSSLYAALSVSTPETPVEVFAGALHGQSSVTYVERLPDLYDVVKPTHVVYQAYSGNDVAAGGMTAAQQGYYRKSLNRFLSLMDQKPSEVLLLEGLPCSYAYKAIGSGDSIRLALNAALSYFVGGQVQKAVGYAAAQSGDVEAHGQTEPKAGFTPDGVHPSIAAMPTLSLPIQDWLRSS